MKALEQRLQQTLRGRVCVVGIGSRLRGDDGAGPSLIDHLRDRTSAAVVDAGIAPENHLEQIARVRPDTVLLVDAVDFGGVPGEIRLFDAAEAGEGALSTHAPSLKLLRAYFEQRAGARTYLLAIQPARLAWNAPLSEEVQKSVAALAEILARLLPP